MYCRTWTIQMCPTQIWPGPLLRPMWTYPMWMGDVESCIFTLRCEPRQKHEPGKSLNLVNFHSRRIPVPPTPTHTAPFPLIPFGNACRDLNRRPTFPHEVSSQQRSSLPSGKVYFSSSCENAWWDCGYEYSCPSLACQSVREHSRGNSCLQWLLWLREECLLNLLLTISTSAFLHFMFQLYY